MTAPTGEVGSVEALPSWGAYLGSTEEANEPPAWQGQNRVRTINRMRNDAQIDSLCNSLTMPMMRFEWRLNPNGARDEVVEQVSTDLGVPVKGSSDPAPRSRRRFKHDDHLSHAILAFWYGSMFFEMVPDTERFDLARDGWRLRKLAPRMPGSVEKIHVAKDGGLEGITQFGYRPPVVARRRGLSLLQVADPQIKVDALAAYVWKREGANWLGRSMLRPLYGPWALKDRALRVDALKNERFGMGIPTATTPEGGDPVQSARLAQAMRASEYGGVGLAPGQTVGVEGVKGTLPDVLASIRYYDEQMAAAFMNMVSQLGRTQTGSRALGETFADIFQMLVESGANWYQSTTNEHVIEDIVDWNFGEDEQAPLLEWAYPQGEQALAISDLVAMVDAGIVTMDAETEAAVRSQTRLPDLPEAEDDGIQDAASSAFTQVGLPALVDSYILTPEEARQLIGVTGPAPSVPQVEAFVEAKRPDMTTLQVRQAVAAASVTVRKGTRKTVPKITVASGPGSRLPFGDAGSDPKVAARKQMIKDPVVGHRQPNDFELAAKTDFAEIQERWQDATADLVSAWRTEVQPAQIDSLVAQVQEAWENGDIPALSQIQAPVVGTDTLTTRMLEMAEDAVVGAKAEAAAQGVSIGTIDVAEDVASLITPRAEATSNLLARGISDSASRVALNLAAEAIGPDEVGAAVREHLEGLTDAYLNDMLGGAMTQAQNTGRRAVMTEKPAQIYASELLDGDTCTNCTGVDAKEYDSLAAAEADYPTGGYKACLGGPRCRGTLVAVYTEGDATPPPPKAPEPAPVPEPEPDDEGPSIATAETLDEDDVRELMDPWGKSIKSTERAALATYSKQTYKETNDHLRGIGNFAPGSKGAAKIEKRRENLQAAIDAAPDLPAGSMVYRGVGSQVSLVEGATFLEPGFMSTTIDPDFAKKWCGRKEGAQVLSIKLKDEGQKGAYIPSVFGDDAPEGEKEMLLGAGTKIKVSRRLDDIEYTYESLNALTGESSTITRMVAHWEVEVVD